MARPATGQVVENETARGVVFAMRFRALGSRRYVTLGTRDEGWDRQSAERELARVLQSVKAGTWAPERTDQVETNPRLVDARVLVRRASEAINDALSADMRAGAEDPASRALEAAYYLEDLLSLACMRASSLGEPVPEAA